MTPNVYLYTVYNNQFDSCCDLTLSSIPEGSCWLREPSMQHLETMAFIRCNINDIFLQRKEDVFLAVCNGDTMCF